MASRILERGDVVGLIKQFEEVGDEEKVERDAVRMLTGKVDLDDFREQIGLLKKIEGTEVDGRELVRLSAMISSMTQDERLHPERFVVTSWDELVEGGKNEKNRDASYDTSRLARVARGSGRKEQEVTDLLDRFTMLRQMMKKIGISAGLLG